MSTVQESIEILKKAQELDRDLYLAQQQLAVDIPEQQATLKRDLEKERSHLSQLEADLKVLQLKQKEKEGLLSQKEANIKKLDSQLSQVKTNKEYTALQQEIASLKADNSLLEEEIIKSMDEVEAAHEEVKRERERLKQIEKDFTAREGHLQEGAKKYKAQIEDLKSKRQGILENIPPDIKERYDIIVKKKQGLALVKINGEICGACQLQIRAQVINELHMGKTLVFCENCSRILYHER
jgi:uncharacterized protein